MDVTKIKSPEPEDYDELGFDVNKLSKLYKDLYISRKFERRIESLFMDEGILYGPAHLALGTEAIAVGTLDNMKDGDQALTHHRAHPHAIVMGIPLDKLMSELFGKQDGTCAGLGGSMHVAIDPDRGGLYASAIVGSVIPIGPGTGYALKKKTEDNVVFTFFGDGAVTTGAFSEGLNMANHLEAPTLFVCENNQYAISFKTDSVCPNIAERAATYKIKSYWVDGNDVLAVHKATQEALEYMREKSAPAFIEACSYRLEGHGVYDQSKYRSDEEEEKMREYEPLRRYRERLQDEGFLSGDEISEIEEEADAELDNAVEHAKQADTMDYEELVKIMEGR